MTDSNNFDDLLQYDQLDDGVEVDIHRSDDDLDYEIEVNSQTERSRSPAVGRPNVTDDVNEPRRAGTDDVMVKEYADLKLENANLKKMLEMMVEQRVEQKLAEGGTPWGIEPSKTPLRTRHDSLGKSANVAKSPSDTTIYVPALRQAKRVEDVVDKISDFVESIHLETA